jgi:hypothetical protein
MAASSFDATGAVQFDLSHGAVRAGSEREPVLLVPCSALDELALSAPAEAEVLGRALGTAIGKRAAARLSDPRAASVESFVTQLAGEFAVAGAGVLSVERWGRALVVVIEESPLAGPLLAPLVASALEATLGKRVSVGLLARDAHVARVLVSSESAVARALESIARGTPWGDVVAQLNKPDTERS